MAGFFSTRVIFDSLGKQRKGEWRFSGAMTRKGGFKVAAWASSANQESR